MDQAVKTRPNRSIRIDPEILHRARIAAVSERTSLGEWLEKAILEKLEADGEVRRLA